MGMGWGGGGGWRELSVSYLVFQSSSRNNSLGVLLVYQNLFFL